MPGIDIRIDDPAVRVDTSQSITVDSAYVPDPFPFVAAGGVQGFPVIGVGPIDTLGIGRSGNRLQQDFPGVTTGCTFDAIPGATFDSSLVTMDRV